MGLAPGTRLGPYEVTAAIGAGDMRAVARAATLDGFIDAASACRGVSLLALDPLTVLHVETRNSVYRIVVSERTAVFVQGGHFFPENSAAHLAGSTFGGSLLKIAWIGVGMQMEIWGDNGPIVTSPVRNITVEDQRSDRTH
jgi:hypothetical protein